MTQNATVRVDELTVSTVNGVKTRSRETAFASLRGFAEVATPKALKTFPGRFERAAYVYTWERTALKKGQILTLTFDSAPSDPKDYELSAVRFDNCGSYYTGVLEEMK